MDLSNPNLFPSWIDLGAAAGLVELDAASIAASNHNNFGDRPQLEVELDVLEVPVTRVRPRFIFMTDFCGSTLL